MQLVIKPLDGTNFIVELVDTATVEDLISKIQEKLSISPEAIHVIHEGNELKLGNTLAESGVDNLASLTLVIRGAPQEEGLEEEHNLSEDDACRSIVLTGFPCAPRTATEEALSAAFRECGEIDQIIFQDDETASSQNAVVVFKTIEAYNLAISLGKVELLGVLVNVMAAVDLRDATTTETSSPGEISNFVGAWLGKGMILGKRGMAHVKKFDAKHGVSTRVKIGATMVQLTGKKLDDKIGVTRTVKKGTGIAQVHVNKIDEKYAVGNKAKKATAKTVEATKKAADKAMENKYVSSGVGFLKGIATSVKTSVKDTYNVAKSKVEEEKKEEHTKAM